MNRLLACAGVAAFLLVSSSGSFAGIAGNTTAEHVAVAGAVYSAQDKHRIDHAEIRLCASDGTILGMQVSDASGEFSFRGLSPADYQLSVTAIGFEHQDVRVDLSLTSDLDVAVYLKPDAGNPHNDARGPSVSAHELAMPQQARELVATAKKKLWIDKNLEGGIADLREALAAAPGYYEVYSEIGMAYLAMDKTADAETNFRKSLELSGGKYGDAEVGLGSALINRGDIAGGEEALRRGIELNPQSWLGRYELGKVELSQNRIADAEKLADEARSLAPNFPSVYRLLGNIHLRQKNYTALLRDVDAYIRLDPDSPAGVRAKQMRDEILRKMPTEVAAAPTSPPPQ